MVDHLEIFGGAGNGRCSLFLPRIQRRLSDGLCWILDGLFRFELGLSEKRANWLIKFVEDLQSDGWLTGVKQYQEFHGRLGFASQVLPWIRTLLSPGYAWLAAVSKRHYFESSRAPGHHLRFHQGEVQIWLEEVTLWQQGGAPG